MPNMITELVIDRVDLVNEGANSEAFIELYKRKESIMTVNEILDTLPADQQSIIKAKLDEVDGALVSANEALAKAKADNESLEAAAMAAAEKAKEEEACKSVTFDETEVLKTAPPELLAYLEKQKAQRIAAEDLLKAKLAEESTAVAVSKAKELKNLPAKEADLVAIIKSASPEVITLLELASKAIGDTLLAEVGKSREGTINSQNQAWDKIETEAEILRKAKPELTAAKAISETIKSNPKLYNDYIKGGVE